MVKSTTYLYNIEQENRGALPLNIVIVSIKSTVAAASSGDVCPRNKARLPNKWV